MRNILPLWMYRWFIGCEPYLLFRCGRAEYNKFISTGMLVLIITLVTGVSSSYVAWDIFVPAAVEHDYMWYSEVLLAFGLASCWTLVIFNLFRFLVSVVTGSDDVGWPGVQGLFSFGVQICVALVLTVAMGFPLSIFLLNSQIDTENQIENNLGIDKVSMTVKFMETHPQMSNLEGHYEKLQKLKLAEVDLRSRAILLKNDKFTSTEIKAALIENQRLQEEQYGQTADIRSQIEQDFLKAKDSELSMHLIKRARFLWAHNAPITVFLLLFIFFIYSSLIVTKVLSPHGLYEYLVKYEARSCALHSGIEEIHLPVPIDGEMVLSHRFHTPDFLIKENIKHLSKQFGQAELQQKNKLVSSKTIGSANLSGDPTR